ncbi:hypothetical protein cyc_07856 [Cyclospora cayetanensis]|uniref:Uncharacterized protein n=1 Tax=Cyclospora cayetanensis TaxID=88456 RepID=A0A1D3CQV4_9EIME|nr:hypothetical protein cyc_07856 [Cyclospora cayetanensis]
MSRADAALAPVEFLCVDRSFSSLDKAAETLFGKVIIASPHDEIIGECASLKNAMGRRWGAWLFSLSLSCSLHQRYPFYLLRSARSRRSLPDGCSSDVAVATRSPHLARKLLRELCGEMLPRNCSQQAPSPSPAAADKNSGEGVAGAQLIEGAEAKLFACIITAWAFFKEYFSLAEDDSAMSPQPAVAAAQYPLLHALSEEAAAAKEEKEFFHAPSVHPAQRLPLPQRLAAVFRRAARRVCRLSTSREPLRETEVFALSARGCETDATALPPRSSSDCGSNASHAAPIPGVFCEQQQQQQPFVSWVRKQAAAAGLICRRSSDGVHASGGRAAFTAAAVRQQLLQWLQSFEQHVLAAAGSLGGGLNAGGFSLGVALQQAMATASSSEQHAVAAECLKDFCCNLALWGCVPTPDILAAAASLKEEGAEGTEKAALASCRASSSACRGGKRRRRLRQEPSLLATFLMEFGDTTRETLLQLQLQQKEPLALHLRCWMRLLSCLASLVTLHRVTAATAAAASRVDALLEHQAGSAAQELYGVREGVEVSLGDSGISLPTVQQDAEGMRICQRFVLLRLMQHFTALKDFARVIAGMYFSFEAPTAESSGASTSREKKLGLAFNSPSWRDLAE